MIEIPLTSNPEQLFSIVLSGSTYDVRIVLNSRTGIWSISFYQGGIPVVEGISLVGGIDIFDQYNIGISNAYVVNLNQPSLDPPKEEFGTVAKLFILTDEEVSGG